MEKIFSVGTHQRSRSCALIASASGCEGDGAVDDQNIITRGVSSLVCAMCALGRKTRGEYEGLFRARVDMRSVQHYIIKQHI